MIFGDDASDEVGNGLVEGGAEFHIGSLGRLEEDGPQIVGVEGGDGLSRERLGVAARGMGLADGDDGGAPGLLGGADFVGGDGPGGEGGGTEAEEDRNRGNGRIMGSSWRLDAF